MTAVMESIMSFFNNVNVVSPEGMSLRSMMDKHDGPVVARMGCRQYPSWRPIREGSLAVTMVVEVMTVRRRFPSEDR